MSEQIRTAILSLASVGALVYAFVPPGSPEWFGAAGALLGGEALARAKGETSEAGGG